MNEFNFLYNERDDTFGNIRYIFYPDIHSSSLVDWSHYTRKDKKVENLKELTKKYRQIRQDVEAGRKEEAIEKSMQEGLLSYPEAKYLVDSQGEDFKKDYYTILDHRMDKLKVKALMESVDKT